MKRRFLVVALLTSFPVFGAEQFGTPGRDGRDAIPAPNGRSGEAQVIQVDGSAHRIVSNGEDGGISNSVGEDGESASSCQQPLNVPFDLVGSNGGNGGRGGWGGNGGNGGAVDLRLNTEADLAKLKKISISNFGGQAGSIASIAGRGGMGCRCLVSRWTVVTADHDEKQFTCTSGVSGADGWFSMGTQKGNYGQVSVSIGSAEVKNGLSIKVPLSYAVGKSFVLDGFVKEKRTGLRALLARDSNVSDSYDFGKYTKRTVRFEWSLTKSPEELGVADETVSAFLGGTVAAPVVTPWVIPTIKGKVSLQDGVTVVTFTEVLTSSDQ